MILHLPSLVQVEVFCATLKNVIDAEADEKADC